MDVTQSIDITADQRKIILNLIAHHLPNVTVWVYGSRVKGTTRTQSDLDMVVLTTAHGQETHVSNLKEALEESNLPFRVDLFRWDEVPENFRDTIQKDHVVLVDAQRN